MTPESKTKVDLFAAGIILFSFLAFISFSAALAKDEGTIGDGAIVNFIADYGLYFFPLLLIGGSIDVFYAGLLIILFGLNILLYSFFVTRLCNKFLVNLKNYKPFLATYYLTIFILLIALIYFIHSIINR
jgi:hypothetical protein